MTPECAQELLDLIMLEDFVSRRKGLDKWVARWVAGLQMEALVDIRLPKASNRMIAQEKTMWKLAKALLLDSVGVVRVDESEDEAQCAMKYVTTISFLRQVPGKP